MLTIFIFVSSSTFYIKVIPFIELVFENPIWGGGTNPPICKRPRENPAGSCQCSVDPVLSSHDEPYFETYLSSQAVFTFVTTSASMEACFTLFLYPFPSTVQNYIQLSLCTNP